MRRNQTTGAANNEVGSVGQECGKANPNKIGREKDAAKQARGGLWKKTRTLEQALDAIDRKTR